MDEIIKKLVDLRWNTNTCYPNTDRWCFFEIRNFYALGVVCVIKEGRSSIEEVKELKDYLSHRSPRFTLKQMGLAIIFSNTPEFVDLSGFISKYAKSITVQKIVQVTPEKIYEQNTWCAIYIDRYLGNFIPDIAGVRKVVTSKIDGGGLEKFMKMNWFWYVMILIQILSSILMFFVN